MMVLSRRAAGALSYKGKDPPFAQNAKDGAPEKARKLQNPARACGAPKTRFAKASGAHEPRVASLPSARNFSYRANAQA
jgi:hypothetical protein